MDNLEIEKMKFIYSALEKGWNVKKNKDKYIFTKKHNCKKEVFSNDFLLRFMKENILTGKRLDFNM
jgi:hypothetical protein